MTQKILDSVSIKRIFLIFLFCGLGFLAIIPLASYVGNCQDVAGAIMLGISCFIILPILNAVRKGFEKTEQLIKMLESDNKLLEMLQDKKEQAGAYRDKLHENFFVK